MFDIYHSTVLHRLACWNSASVALTVISALQHMATSLFENVPALYRQIIRYGRSEAVERTAIKIIYFNLQGHIPETSENSLFNHCFLLYHILFYVFLSCYCCMAPLSIIKWRLRNFH